MTRTLSLIAIGLVASIASAETSVKVQTNGTTANQRSNSMDPLRASQLMGLNVVNAKDETVGEINDIVLNKKDGSVKYVAVSIGGFLGIGDKLFAVPFKKFKCTQDEDGDCEVVLNVDRKTLENVNGFDQDNWPNMADSKWQMTNDRAYGQDR